MERPVYGQFGGYAVVAFDGGVAYQSFIGEGLRREAGIQAVDVAVGEIQKDFFGVFGRLDAGARVKSQLRVIQSPRQVEPSIYPKQIFAHLAKRTQQSLLAADDGIDRIEHYPCDAEGYEHIANGKGEEGREGRKYISDAGVEVLGIPLSPRRNLLGQDDVQQQKQQQAVTGADMRTYACERAIHIKRMFF